MKLKNLTYGNESFNEIKEFLDNIYNKNYTLSIYNELAKSTLEIKCEVKEMLDIIINVCNMEHDFPRWIGVNDLSYSVVVGMKFTRGHFQTPSYYEYIDGKLREIDQH